MENEKETLISVIVPCYNHAKYLVEALDSVFNQSISNWECIIIDDGSTDNTKEISNNWVSKDSRFQYWYIKNSGVVKARNYGISIAKGNYILPLDADDRISKDYMYLALKAFNKNIKVVYSKAEKFGYVNGFWHLKDFSHFNLAVGNIIFCSAFFRKSDWESIGGYDTNMQNGLEDWEFWINLLKKDGLAHQIDKVCFFYRVNKKSRNSSINYETKEELLNYISIKHSDFFVKQFGSFHSYMKNGLSENARLKNLLRSRKNALKILLRGIISFNK